MNTDEQNGKQQQGNGRHWLLPASHGPTNRPRCECHECTQARIPQWDRQLASLGSPAPAIQRTAPPEFVDSGDPRSLTAISAYVQIERERCARIAEGLEIAAFGSDKQIRGLLRQHTARIATKIRSGE